MRIRMGLLPALVAVCSFGQDVVQLPISGGAASESYPEKQYFSKAWNAEVVSNITHPSLTVYKPADGTTASGIGVIICPGGGFMALSIQNEGTEVAKWLSARGVTAFVLKYRVAHTGEDATQEFQQLWKDKEKFSALLRQVVPLSIADGLTAVEYVKKHAGEFGVSADKVGIMGFSAGGTVTAAAAMHYGPEGRPAFAAPIYGAADFLKYPVPSDAPPLFIAAASDDNLGLAPESLHLYEQWTAGRHPAELHMYAMGRHGFGMRKQGLPSDEWIDRFWDWLRLEAGLPGPASHN